MKELIKRNAFIFTIMTICFFPSLVFAKTYNYPDDVIDILYRVYNKDIVVFHSGDVIVFNTEGNDIYIDGNKVSNECYGNECSTKTYTVTSNICFSYEKVLTHRVDFVSCDNNVSVYSPELKDKAFKSGDLIVFKDLDYHTKGINPMVFGFDDNLLFSHNTFAYAFDNYYSYSNSYSVSYGGYLLLKLPQINDKDVYWKISIFSDGSYGYPNPHFTPVEYTEPKIELKCDKDKINYGEKTKCEVCIECTHAINKLEFSMNQKDLKFSNYNFSNGITNTGNNNSIKLNITDNNICNEKKTIMTFDVESTKDTNYLNKITLKNLAYTDEILTGNYNDLDSNLNIISVKDNISNPKTGTRLLFIIIPVILLPIIGGLSFIRRKKYEK